MDNNIIKNQNNTNEELINIRELLLKYLRKWYWFALAVIIALIVAFVYIRSTTVKYQVQTVILLRNDRSSAGLPQAAMMDNLGFNTLSKETEDEIQVISSRKIIGQAIDSLNFQIEYFTNKGLKSVELYQDAPFQLVASDEQLNLLRTPLEILIKEQHGTYRVTLKGRHIKTVKHKLSNLQEPFETPIGTLHFSAKSPLNKGAKYKIKVYPFQSLLASYGDRLKVGTANKKSNAISISLVGSNIAKAEDFLNKVVELYNLDAIVDKNIIATNTASFINDRLNIITKELFDVESDVENYKRSNRLTDLSSEATLYLETASAYEKRLTELETQLNMVNSVESYIKDPKNATALIPSNIITEDAALAKTIQDYNLLVLERMKLSQTASEKNPALVQANQQIEALRSNVVAGVNSVKSGIQIARNNVLRQGAQFNTKIRSVPTQERQFLEIKRQQEIKQSLYLFLSQKREETALSLASTAPAARTIDKAYASLSPVAPKGRVIYLAALVLGLLLPFLYIYLKDLINNKVEDPKEFQRLIKAPYLGSIGTSRESDTVVVQEGKTTPIVEMFRLIRTNLQFIVSGTKSPVILVTSTMSGEGKSFISINLSMSFALMKKKVLLIGLDVRSPMLSKYLHFSNSNGVTLFLADETIKPEEVVYQSGQHPYLDVIPAGPVPPNPAELIMSQRLEALVQYAKEHYDYIIIDTAPIGLVSDTYILNRIADNSIFVARQNYTPKDATVLINEIYTEKRLNGMGVILNGTSSGTSYGYGYGSDTKRRRKYQLPKMTFNEKLSGYYRNYLRNRKKNNP